MNANIFSKIKLSLSIVIISIFICFLFGCGEAFETEGVARFKEPQPQGVQQLSCLPSKLTGIYLSLNDNSTVVISNYNVNRIYDYWTVINIKELDSTVVLKGDTLYERLNGTKYPVIVKGDSLYLHHYSNEVVFRIDDRHKVKQFRGNYFLNTRRKEDSLWTVQKLSRVGDTLILSMIASDEAVKKLGELTHTAIDTSSIQNFEPNKKAFKKFVKSDGFSEWETFRKVK